MNTRSLSREQIRERTDVLALASNPDKTDVVSERTEVSAFFEQLRQSGSTIPEHLIKLAHQLTDEEYDRIGPEIPKVVLQSIIARAIQAGAATAINDTGSSALQAKELDHLVTEA